MRAMNAKRKKHRNRAGGRPEMFSRTVAVSSFSATVRIGAVHRRGEEPEVESQPWLKLRGTLDEPVRGIQTVVISMYPRDKVEIGTARPASIGAVIGMRQEMSVVLTWPQGDFGRVWAPAVGGLLKFGRLYFTTPRYNTGLVVSASFSNEREE